MPRNNLFRKMVLLMTVMLVPIMGLYVYSNQTSTVVIREQLNQSNKDQLVFFQSQVDSTIESISLWANLLIHDPDIADFRNIFDYNGTFLDLDTMTLIKRMQRKISIQESSLNWKSEILIYSPTLGRVVSVDDMVSYNGTDLQKRIAAGWQVEGMDGHYMFSLFTVSPYSSFEYPQNANIIIEVRFDSRNITQMLDTFKGEGDRNPFYYKPGVGAIYNSTSDEELANKLVKALNVQEKTEISNRIVNIDGSSYLVNALISGTTGWHLIDYMPLSGVLQPIEKSNRVFYISTAALLVMSSMIAYLLYAQVQVPMKQLVRSFQRLKNEDYSVRLQPRGNSEFSFVFTRFNLMVAQIQDLFKRVYLERIHVREAKLKQLQSQINPHFFYNCFSFITSMAKLGNTKAVVAMSESLAKYYRYTTRQEREFVPLEEEMDLVTNYLNIQKMRMKRLEFEIDLPEHLNKVSIPPLVIQPLVENAVIHGIESSAGNGMIRITALKTGGVYQIVVDDNGKGMDSSQMEALKTKLSLPMEEEMGCGLWNVHQRLQLRYGGRSGIAFMPSPLGGLRVLLQWDDSEMPGLEEENV